MTTSKNPEKAALAALKRKAARGHAGAQFDLANRYLGNDNAEAEKWYLLAGQQGDVSAQNTLGVLYSGGFPGVEANLPLAARWFECAAEQGDAPSQNSLGILYMTGGEGLQVDLDAAVFWFVHALQQLPIQENLANAYLLAENHALAFRWYLEAAKDDLATAYGGFGQFNLARMYEKGQGTPRNPSMAMVWYDLAAAQGNKKAERAAARLRRQAA